MKSLIRKYGFHNIDMCAYGLKCPKSNKPIQKRTGIVCSDYEAFAKHARVCSRDHEHQHNEGSVDSKTTRCAMSACYTTQCVDAVWESLGPPSVEVLCAQPHPLDWAGLQIECLAARRAQPEADAEEAPPGEEVSRDPEKDRKIDLALKKLHSNLGHPSSRGLIRVLRHSGASQLAVERATLLQCSVCANHQRPSAPLPANTDRVKELKDRVGLDVKHVTGWSTGHKQVCVNIVDYATSLQVKERD